MTCNIYYSPAAITETDLSPRFQDIWPCEFTYGNVHDNRNPLRCIFNDHKVRLTYFENMSRAMAKLCSDVFATVMTEDTKNVPKTGIYGRIEEQELIDGGIDTVSGRLQIQYR